MNRIEQHNKAQRDYRKTERGKETHREAEKRRRLRQAEKNKISVDDETIQPDFKSLNSENDEENNGIKEIWIDKKSGKQMERCRFCGKVGEIVYKFGKREPKDGSFSFSHPLRI